MTFFAALRIRKGSTKGPTICIQIEYFLVLMLKPGDFAAMDNLFNRNSKAAERMTKLACCLRPAAGTLIQSSSRSPISSVHCARRKLRTARAMWRRNVITTSKIKVVFSLDSYELMLL